MNLSLLKKIVCLSALLLAALHGTAQPADPVSWSVAVSESGDGISRIVFKARIAEPWHMYDTGPYDGGPNATAFTFEPNADVTLLGGIEQLSKPVRVYDSLFAMEIGYFEKNAEFVQKVRVAPGPRNDAESRGGMDGLRRRELPAARRPYFFDSSEGSRRTDSRRRGVCDACGTGFRYG